MRFKSTRTHGVPKFKNGIITVQPSEIPYKRNAVATLQCRPGFKIKGDSSSTLLLNPNNDLVWVPASLECEPITMDLLPQVDNGVILSVLRKELLAVAPYMIYDRVVPKCPPGYTFKAGVSVLFQVEGKEELEWSPPVIRCEPKETYDTPHTINGRSFAKPGPPFTVGATARVDCNSRHEPYNATTSKLTLGPDDNLLWDPPTLQCDPVSTYEIPTVENGLLGKVMEGTKEVNPPYREGSYVAPLCQAGYEFPGGKALLIWKDREGLTWNPETIPCRKMICPDLKAPRYGKVRYARTERSLATYTCGDPSVPSVQRTCLANGTWSGDAPICPALPRSFFVWFVPLFLVACLLLFSIIRMGRRHVILLESERN